MRAAISLLALLVVSQFVRTPIIKTLVYIAIGILAAYLLFKIGLRLVFAWAASRSSYAKRRQSEEETQEVADWIGRTGLGETIERELPRYLRRELHEFLDAPEGLRAAQLRYLGILGDERGLAHFWELASRSGSPDPTYAYVAIDEKGAWAMGWGDRQPQDGNADSSSSLTERKTFD